MKTFIAALIIFAVLCTLVCNVSSYIKEQTGLLSELAEALPESTEAFRNDKEVAQKTKELCALWAQSMVVFPYIMGYDMLDRADEAALSLAAAAETKSEEDFLAARLRFIDAIGRLSGLFALTAESIF